MNLPFENKVALVTGAGSGMGLATATAFAEKGAAVALADINEGAVRSAAENLVAAAHKALAIHCNVVDEADVEARLGRPGGDRRRCSLAVQSRSRFGGRPRTRSGWRLYRSINTTKERQL